MSDNDQGTPEVGEEAQETGTPAAPDEVTRLRSRNAGLDAKVTELSKTLKALNEELASAKSALDEAQKGVVDKDEAFRAQLTARESELAELRTSVKVATIARDYPETYGVFGEAVANMSSEQLAAAEARFAGIDNSEPAETKPKPVGNNPTKQVGTPTPTSAKDRLSALEQKLASEFATAFPDL
jgi:hypothetical protein